ncbi:MAG: putative peptidoglycan glycosyltransferase FtsW, partial [Planctomycetota bacterium]
SQDAVGKNMLTETFTSKEQMEHSSRWIMGIVAMLLMLGIVMVYSAKTVKMARLDGDPMAPLTGHAIKVGLGLAGMLLMMRFDYRWLGRHYGKIFLCVVCVLIMVLIPCFGAEINGARRWFRIAGNMAQPSEFAKLGVIIVVASLIVRAGNQIQDFNRGLLPALAAVSLICLLILKEPDFGTAAITGCLAVTLLVIGGVKIKYFTAMTLFLAPLMFIYAYSSMGHVAARIGRFLNRPPGGQVDMSLMAIALGGPSGAGLGASRMKLNLIPECESDFIFAIIGEELGFIGSALVLFLFCALLYHGIKIILGIRNRFGFIMATGILLLITAQALVNITVVVGLAPTKGLPLPFISSGGSSLIALMMGIGLFLNIARNPDLTSEKIKDKLCEAWFFGLKEKIRPVRIQTFFSRRAR